MTDSINREDVIRMAKESGFKACVGTTDKEGNYHPFVNALGKDIPIEWLERFAALAALRAQPDHSELVTAARAVVERWETPLWKDAPATAGYINRLRDALPAIGETMV